MIKHHHVKNLQHVLKRGGAISAQPLRRCLYSPMEKQSPLELPLHLHPTLKAILSMIIYPLMLRLDGTQGPPNPSMFLQVWEQG